MTLFAVSCLWLSVGTSEVRALEKSDYIDTNRPSFCQSALVVPDGSLQIENGGVYQRFRHSLNYFDCPETELRLGLLKHTEFQIYTPMAVINSIGSSTVASATGLNEIGIKKQVGPFKRLTASVVGALNLPVGTSSVPGTSVQPLLRIPYSFQISRNWALCGMQSIILTNSHGDIRYEPFGMLTRSIGDKAGIFAEYGGFFQQNTHQPAPQIAHFGGIYKLNRHNQVGLHFGFGMTKAAPTAFIGVGYSYRFDGLPWPHAKKPPPQEPVKTERL